MEEITLSNFDYGSHVILANYSGDSNSLNDSKNITFTVSDNRNNLNFVVYSGSESNEINYGDNLILTPCFSIWSCWRKFQLLY